MSGWFSVKRGITSHPIFKGRPERLAIWIWLIDNAVWKDTPHDVSGKTIMVRRGSVCASERRIAAEAGVGYQVVRTFLARLKAEHMINATVTHGRNVITLCNYEKYQSSKPSDNAQDNAGLTQRQRTKEQGNNLSDTYVSGEADFDPVKVMFDSGIALLGQSGVPASSARSVIGKWRAAHGVEAVIAALGRAKREGAIEPVAFIEGCFRRRKSQDEEMFGAFGRIREVG